MSIINLVRKDNQPFTQIPNHAIRDPRITPNAFRLLAYLMSHQDGYELNYEQIEYQTGLGRYAINQAADLLVDLGWLEVNRPKVAGKFACKQWVVLCPNANESIAGDSTMEQPHMGQSTDIRKTINKEEQLEEEKLKAIPQNEFEAVDFDHFWNLYPRKVGKEAARSAWAKALLKASIDEIVAGAFRYAHDPNLPEKTFIPHPSTWLNEGRWSDEPLPERPKSLPELKTEEVEIRKRKLDAEKQATADLIAEIRSAKSEPPPICQHGEIIIKCRKCLLGIN